MQTGGKIQAWRLASGAGVVLLCLSLQHTVPLEWVETRLYDLRIRLLSSQHVMPSGVVVIGIDEPSLKRMEPVVGRWPWPRAVLASVIDFCSQAKVIALDVLLPEGDWQYQQSDNLLVETVAAYGHQVNTLHLNDQALNRGHWEDLDRFALSSSFDAWTPAREYSAALPPFGALLKASAGVGHVNLVVDPDGVARRHAAVLKVRGKAFPSLALAAVAHAQGIQPADIRYEAGRGAVVGDRVVPMDGEGCFRLYPSRWSYSYHSIADVMSAWQAEDQGRTSAINRQAFKDKIILIGALAAGVFEDRAVTPISTRTGGVEILATAVENMLHGRYIRDWMGWSWIFIAVYALSTASARLLRPHSMLIVIVSVLVFHVILVFVALMGMQAMLPVAGPLSALAVGAVVQGSFSWYEERRNRRRMEALDAAKDQLTSMVVHDLRSVLSPIVLGVEMVERSSDERLVRDLFLPTVRDSSDQLLCQINAMLDARRMQDGRLTLDKEHIDARAFIDRLLGQYEMAARRVNCVLMPRCSGEGLDLYADAGILDRILRNLLWNAIKYADSGTSIEVGCTLGRDGGVNIFVRNRCRPIPEDRQQALFKAFEVEERDGDSAIFHSVGLGLAFCKMAAEVHGGSIRMESPCAGWSDGVQITVHLPGDANAGDE